MMRERQVVRTLGHFQHLGGNQVATNSTLVYAQPRLNWTIACIVAWALFLAMQIFGGLSHRSLNTRLCRYESKSFHIWYKYVGFSIVGVFGIIWTIFLWRIVQRKSNPDISPYVAYFNVISMGLITSILSLIFDWGGICMDGFG